MKHEPGSSRLNRSSSSPAARRSGRRTAARWSAVALLCAGATFVTGPMASAATMAPAGGQSAHLSGVGGTGAPVSIVLIDGVGQMVQTGHSFPDWLVAKVVDSNGAGVAGVPVTYTISPPAGADTGTAGFSGGVQSVVVDTNADGFALNSTSAALLTAGRIGQFDVTAAAAGVTGPVDFPETVVAPVPMPQFVSGDAQVIGHGQQFPEPVTVLVNDQYGAPVANWPVTFSLSTAGYYTASAAFAGGATSVTVYTNAQGRAVSPLITAGPTAGQVLLEAHAAQNSYVGSELTVN